MGKEENAGDQHFSPFLPQYFWPFPNQISILESYSFFKFTNTSIVDMPRVLKGECSAIQSTYTVYRHVG